MKRCFLLFLCCLSVFELFAQSKPDVLSISLKRHYYNRNGMIILTSWAGANIIEGSIGHFTTQNKEWRHFQEMNVFVNTINLGLGVAGLIRAPREKPDESWSLHQAQNAQRKIELVFGINAGLDVLYVGTGLLMRHFADPTKKSYSHLRGYGTSFIVQGAFLFIFDGVEFVLNRQNGRGLYRKNNGMSIAPYGLGLTLAYRFD